MAKPITERITIVGNQLIVEDCDGNKVYLDIPCTCGDNPDGDDGEYPPVEGGGGLCALANYYSIPMYNIMSYLQDPALSTRTDNLQGWQRAAGDTAQKYDLGATFINQAVARLATTPYRENFNSVPLPRDGSLQSFTTAQAITCLIYSALIDGYGTMNYDILRAKFQAAGYIGFGQLATAVPLAKWNELAFNFGTGLADDYDFVFDVDCQECDDTPPNPGTDCDTCGLTDCLRWLPSPILNPGVSGFDNVGIFGSSGQPYWFCEGGNLTIDLGSNKCVERVLVRNYTPQGAGGTIRSNLLRFELDNVPVSEFRGQTFGAINPGDCGIQNDFVTVLETTDGNPKLGRYVKIVGNNGQEFIVQVDVIVCLDE